MPTVETLNGWGAAWAAAMTRSLVDASILLALVLVVWLPVRRRVSGRLACVLFLLVLLKAALPFPVTVSARVARFTPGSAADRVLARPPAAVADVPIIPKARERGATGLDVFDDAIPGPPIGDAWPSRPRLAAVPPAAPDGRPPVRLGVAAALMLAWAVVAMALAARFAWSHARMARRLRGAARLDPRSLPVDFGRLCERCGIGSEVPLLVTAAVPAPAAWGLVRPKLLVPPGLVEALAPGQLTWVLLHELVHVRRRDAWVVAFQRLVQIVYVFHPAVWVANHLIDVHREYACDDAALALAEGVSRRDCGAGFLAVIERAATPHPGASPALGLFGSYTFLRRRLMRILDAKRSLPRRPSRRAALALGLLALLAIPYARAREPRQAPESAETPGPQNNVLTVDVRVVGQDDGRPIAGATVEASFYREGYEKRLGTTDAEGRCKLASPPGESTFVIVSVANDGFVPLGFRVSRGDKPLKSGETLEHTFRLPRGERVGGLVRDEAGGPVAGAKVVFWFQGKSGGSGDEHYSSSETNAATTDAEGRWRADVLPATAKPADKLLVRLHHPDYASDRVGFSRSLTAEEARTGTAALVMKTGVPVAGRVVGPDGTPVAGAAVVFGFSNSDGDCERTRTGADGAFRFPHVDPIERRVYNLTVEASGFAAALKEIEPGKDLPPQEFRLERGVPVRGRVINPTGAPVAGAVVKLSSVGVARHWEWKGETDADGGFVWPDGPAAGELRFNVAKPPFTRAMGRKLEPSDVGPAITLHRPIRLRGTVVDAETGKPVDTFTLIPGWGPDRPGASVSWRRDGSSKTIKGGAYDETDLFPDQGLIRSLRVEADGYLPSEFLGFRDDDGEIVHDFKLTRGAGLSGTVELPDGRPAEGAVVVLSNDETAFRFNNGRFDDFFLGLGVHAKTGADGRYAFKPQAKPSRLTAAHDAGFVTRSPEDLANSADLTLEPWGRIEGTVRVGAKPGAGLDVGAYVMGPQDAGVSWMPILKYTAKADADSRFVIDRVVPGDVTVHRVFAFEKQGTYWTHLAPVTVAPGATVRVTLGGGGRTVVGRVAAPGGTAPTRPTFAKGLLSVDLPPPTPPDFATYGATQRQAWFAAFRKTDEGKAYYAKQNRYGVTVDRDGRLRAEDVPPGHYTLTLSYQAPGDVGMRPAASASREVDVPEADPGREGEPVDVGEVPLKLVNLRTVEVGQAAPDLSCKTLDGKPLALADFRGKFVLLDFWATWCVPCLEETPSLKAVHDAFGKNDRFVMVGLSLDDTPDAPRQYAEKNGLAWTQAFLGAGDANRAATDFGVDGIPSVWLIGPDGKVVAKNLRGDRIKEAVAGALRAK